MSSKIPGAKLKKLVELSHRKEALLAEIQDIQRAMERLEQQFSQSANQKTGKARVTVSTESKRRRNVRSAAPAGRRKKNR
ncbi:MAG TPA: hypothetical protein VGM62_18920 [Chthoniobacterales bacterium]